MGRKISGNQSADIDIKQTGRSDKLIRVNREIGFELEMQLLNMKRNGVKETEKEFTEKAIEERINKLKCI